MPFVIPVPLGGLGTEIGTLTDRLQAQEAARSGAAIDFVTSVSVPNTGANNVFAIPTGTPTVTIATPAGGGALMFAGLVSTSGVRVGISIDGGAVTIQGPWDYDTSSCIWYSPLSMNQHTFTLETAYNGAGATATNLFLVVVPC